ncbi:MAG: 23S rRNA (pseudouridine(1915)-N(3))-methyltransferase RlmH [Bacteroidales bacterium]|jgi:23S rRNA (pseudouridine1915-N3)-methyltransferase|nr:23S rRNA (pseudouridine(1915)-N(3))-methyltransferase RlmH [Bacteroidales bacterium]
MRIALIFTGKTTERFIKEGINNYTSRISKYTTFDIITIPEIKNTRNMPVREQKIKEGAKIFQSVRSDDYIILLDDKGNEFTTTEFAGMFGKVLMVQRKRIVFIIGGPWGFAEEVYSKADLVLSLSRMTFSHQLVRLLFLEQLYRILTVINGDPYHHE